MGDSFDTVISALNISWIFLKQNVRGLFLDFIKLYILLFVIELPIIGMIVAIIILGGITSIASFSALVLTNIALLLFLGFLVFVLIIVMAVVSSAFYSVTYKLVEARKSGNSIDIWKSGLELLVPVGKYSIVTTIIALLIFAPAIIVFVSSFLSLGKAPVLSLAVMFGSLALFMFCYVVYLVLAFFIQFSLLEIVFNRLPLIESLKVSYQLVRKNLVTVFIFDIAFGVIIYVLSMFGSMLIQYGIGLWLYLLSVLNPLFLLFAVAVVLVLFVLWSALVAVVHTAMLYFFWKLMKEGGQKENPDDQPAKIKSATISPVKMQKT